MTHSQKNAAFKDTVLGVIAETVEFLDRVNWKMHVNDKLYDRKEQILEVVDIFKYALNLLVYMDIPEEEFKQAFYSKTTLVLKRFEREFPGAKNEIEASLGRLQFLQKV